jgi:hypothetical protein
MQHQCILSSNGEPPFTGCTCLVVERGYAPAHKFIAEFYELDALVSLRFTGCEVVIVIRTPEMVLNSIGCTRQDTFGAIRYACNLIRPMDSRWGVLCTPAISLVAMAFFNGAYDFLLEDAA